MLNKTFWECFLTNSTTALERRSVAVMHHSIFAGYPEHWANHMCSVSTRAKHLTLRANVNFLPARKYLTQEPLEQRGDKLWGRSIEANLNFRFSTREEYSTSKFGLPSNNSIYILRGISLQVSLGSWLSYLSSVKKSVTQGIAVIRFCTGGRLFHSEWHRKRKKERKKEHFIFGYVCSCIYLFLQLFCSYPIFTRPVRINQRSNIFLKTNGSQN